jgi:charged multivesicular body protein 5
MNRVFGKKKAPGPPPPSLDDASSGLGGRIETMDAKIAACENELKVYKDKIKKAKSPAAKKTLQKRALEILKRKRMYEQQRDAVAGQQFNIDQASFGLESAKASITTVAAMKAANMELKRTLKKDLDIDAVEDMADDMAELMEDFNEINEALGRNFATPDDLDEADLDAELELLEDELGEELDELEADATPSYLQASKLPAHPTGVPGSQMPTAPVDDLGLTMPQVG